MGHNLFVATPAFAGLMGIENHSSYIQLEMACHELKVGLCNFLYADSLISRARNACLASFMTMPEFSHFLFIDADISYEPEAVFRLFYLDKDVMGTAYRRRGGVGHVIEFDAPVTSGRQNIPTYEGFAKAKYIGTGFMMIKRATVEKMIAAYPDRLYLNDDPNVKLKEIYDLFPPIVVNKRLLSEDYGFCHLAAEAGCEVWCDLQTPLTHKCSQSLTGSFMSMAASGTPSP